MGTKREPSVIRRSRIRRARLVLSLLIVSSNSIGCATIKSFRLAKSLPSIEVAPVEAKSVTVAAVGRPEIDQVSEVSHFELIESLPSEAVMVEPAVVAQMSEWEVVETAIANHPKTNLSQHRLRASIAQLDQAKSTYWPELSSHFSFTKIRQDVTAEIPAASLGVPFPGNFSLPIAGDEFRTASLDANLPLYAGGARIAAVDLAGAGVRIAKQETRLTENDIVATARKAYYGTILTRNMQQLAIDTRAQLELTHELTVGMMNAGSEQVDRTDLLKSTIAIAAVDSMVAEANGRRQLARTALANAVGASAAVEVEALDAELTYQPFEGDLEQMVAEAYLFRPDWKQIQDAVCAAQSKIDLAKSGFHPKVLASGSLLNLHDNLDYGAITPNGDNWKVGVYAQVPFFTGFRTVNEVKEAEARFHARRCEQQLLRDGIGVQVKAAFVDLIQTRDQIAASQSAWQAAVENRELNFRGYQIGMIETKDLLQAQLTETAMKKDHLMALYNWNIARVELDHVTGHGFSQLLE